MARTKTRPKLHQPSPEPEQRTNTVKGTSEEKYLPAADEELGEEQMSYMTKLFLSKFSSNHERPEKLPVTRKRTPTPVETISETIERNVEAGVKPPRVTLLSSVGLDQLIDENSNIDIPTCPNCHSEFRDAVLLEFRQHVEACTRPTTANSGSDVSSLSPPPESPTGLQNSGDGPRKGFPIPGEDSDEEFPYPYEEYGYDILPETKVTVRKALASKEQEFGDPESRDPESGDPEPGDPEPAEPEPGEQELGEPESGGPESGGPESTVAEPEENDVLQEDDAEGEGSQLTFKFPKITDTSKFAKSLEDTEDLPYDKLYARVENAQQALATWQNEYIDLQKLLMRYDEREPTKPRVPKPHLIGLGYEDQLESYIYGYEHNSHKSKLGEQKPVQQRIVRGPAAGRELRQRVPTQRATEADLTEGPDSDIEHGIDYGRPESNDQDDVGSRRGSRIRNQTSRFNSESRQTPPKRTFPSGKPIGRPKKEKIRYPSGYRIAELQLEHASGLHSNGYQTPTTLQSLKGVRRIGDNGDVVQSMEQDTDDADSRPGTSSSIMTGASDDLQAQSSNRIRKRQNTSDFEDALPASKRIRQQGNVETEKSKIRGVGDHTKTNENSGATKNVAEPSSRSIKMKNTQLNAWARDDGTRRKKQSEDTKKRWEEKKALGYTTLSGPPASPLSTKSKTKKPAAKTRAAEQTENGETKQSAASKNMLRRWAEKRRAQELGLPVPKIGRYAKGQTPASTTPDTDKTSDQVAPQKGATNKKRKRLVEEFDQAEDGEATENDLPPKKKRITNQKQSESPKAEAETSVIDPASGNENEETAGSKQRSRGKKIVEESSSPTNAYEAGDAPADGATVAKATGRGRKATTVTDRVLTTEAVEETQSAQQMQTRTSGRIRRQTSAAASSSQNNTRRSSHSSEKMTPTPTPGPIQPATQINGEPDQLAENIAIKEEPLAAPPMPKKKRGRGPNYEWVPIDPVAEAAAAENDRISLEETSGKTRRTRQPKIISDGKTAMESGVSIAQMAQREASGKAKRNQTLKSTVSNVPGAGAAIGDSTEAAQGAVTSDGVEVVGAEIITTPLQAGEPQKGTSGSLRSKKTAPVGAEPNYQETNVGIIEGKNDIEAAKARAKKSKSEKMSAVMRGRWASGQMKEVMAKKKANNRARKEAAATGGVSAIDSAFVKPQRLSETEGTGKYEAKLGPESEAAPAPASAPLPARRSSRTPKRRRIAIYDGAGDDLDEDSHVFMSSPLGGRSRRPAALRASQSFSKIIGAADNEDDDEEELDSQNEGVMATDDNYTPPLDYNNNEEVEDFDREIKRQFDSEYDHFQAPGRAPGILLGKRKRKPVNKLEEAMRIELGEEEDDYE